MLTIQPKIANNYRPAFKSSEDFDIASMNQEEFDEINNELKNQKDEFHKLTKDYELPKIAKKVLEGGAIVTTGLLGGMATGWGAKKSIAGFAKLAKTGPMQVIKKHEIATKNFIVDTAKTIKNKFISSDAYKMPVNSIKKGYVIF